MQIFRVVLVTSVAAALALGAAPLAGAEGKGDKAIAEKALLKQSDLPESSEWDSEPRDPEDESAADRIRKEIFECFALQRKIDDAKKYRTVGPTYTRRVSTGNQSVSDTVWVFPKVKTARSFMAPFTDDEGIDCFRKTLLEGIKQRVTDEEVLVQSIERAPELGDSSLGYILTATITAENGAEQKLYANAYLIRVGRGVTGLSNQSSNAPFAEDEETAINEAAAERLEQAL